MCHFLALINCLTALFKNWSLVQMNLPSMAPFMKSHIKRNSHSFVCSSYFVKRPLFLITIVVAYERFHCRSVQFGFNSFVGNMQPLLVKTEMSGIMN